MFFTLYGLRFNSWLTVWSEERRKGVTTKRNDLFGKTTLSVRNVRRIIFKCKHCR